MTVGDLKEKLKGVPDGRRIVLSSDPEGNRWWGAYDAYPEEPWAEDHLAHKEDIKEGYYENKSREDFETVVYISPKHKTP